MEISMDKFNDIIAKNSLNDSTDIPINSLEGTLGVAQRTLLQPIKESFINCTSTTNHSRGLSLLCQFVYHMHKDIALWASQGWTGNMESEANEALRHVIDFQLLLRDFGISAHCFGGHRKNAAYVYKVFLSYIKNAVVNILHYMKGVAGKQKEPLRRKLICSYYIPLDYLIKKINTCLESIETILNTSTFVFQAEQCVWEVKSRPSDDFPDILNELGVRPPPSLLPKNAEMLRKVKMTASEFLASSPNDICTICLEILEGIKFLTILPHCNHVFHYSCLRKGCESDESRSWRCSICRREVPMFFNVKVENDGIVPVSVYIRNVKDFETSTYDPSELLN